MSENKDKTKTSGDFLLEFYPESAEDCAKRGDELECVRHALRKWRGIPLAEGYGLRISNSALLDANGEITLVISSDTCALCCLYTDIHAGELRQMECIRCVLTRVRGCRCYYPVAEDKEFASPWGAWMAHNDPLPMIKLLESAEVFLVKERSGKTVCQTPQWSCCYGSRPDKNPTEPLKG